MEDIVQASGMIARREGETGMTRDDLAKARDLLQKYGDERSRLFDQMVSLLSKPEGDGITDAWKDLSEKGSALLEGVDNDVPKSPVGERLTGLGAGDFFVGEKKVWAENGKGQLALVADVLVKVKAANMGLVQQCNDELKSIRDTNSDVQSALNESLEGIKADLLDLVNQLVSRGSDKTLTAWMKEGQAKEYIKKWNESVVQRTDENGKALSRRAFSRNRSKTNWKCWARPVSSWMRNGSKRCTDRAKKGLRPWLSPAKWASIERSTGRGLGKAALSRSPNSAMLLQSSRRSFLRNFCLNFKRNPHQGLRP